MVLVDFLEGPERLSEALQCLWMFEFRNDSTGVKPVNATNRRGSAVQYE